MVPDYKVICENMLMAEGFVDATVLARKFTQLYALCRDLLSASLHYDWGLRAINSVLVKAGEFKRDEPALSEDDILLRALRDFNTPKIIQADFDIFMNLLGDLFPGIDVPRKRDMELEKVIVDTVISASLTDEPNFIKKIVQFKELCDVRWSIFVMGPSASGKSEVWKMLAKA
jgi:dynein heavy chain